MGEEGAECAVMRRDVSCTQTHTSSAERRVWDEAMILVSLLLMRLCLLLLPEFKEPRSLLRRQRQKHTTWKGKRRNLKMQKWHWQMNRGKPSKRETNRKQSQTSKDQIKTSRVKGTFSCKYCLYYYHYCWKKKQDTDSYQRRAVMYSWLILRFNAQPGH